MEKHCENAVKVAEFLRNHPAVDKVYFPGFEDFPQAEIVKKQISLPGSNDCF